MERKKSSRTSVRKHRDNSRPLRLTGRLEGHRIKTKAYRGKLTQSILAKAFRGELVEQAPNDEPASALLKPIRQTEPAVPARHSRRRAPFKNATRLTRHKETTV